MKRNLLLLVLLALVVFSCEKEEEATKVVIVCEAASTEKFVETGTKLLYSIEVYATESFLKEFRITSFDIEMGEQIVLDTLLQSTLFEYPLIYEVPEFSKDSIAVQLRMQAKDINGNSQLYNRNLVVIGGAMPLMEYSGIVMYSGATGRPDAFSLNDPTQVFVSAMADSADIDVYSYVDIDHPEQFTLTRKTNTDVWFTRVNNFNYASATTSSVRETYFSMIRQRSIDNIQQNDIILLGWENEPFGVIQIADVVDNDGDNNDFYRFNLKQLSNADK